MKKINILSCMVLLMLSLSMTSCSDDLNITEEDEQLVFQAKPRIEFCIYNITVSSVPTIQVGDKYCHPCYFACGASFHGIPVKDNTGIIGHISGELESGGCKICPPNGVILHI